MLKSAGSWGNEDEGEPISMETFFPSYFPSISLQNVKMSHKTGYFSSHRFFACHLPWEMEIQWRWEHRWDRRKSKWHFDYSKICCQFIESRRWASPECWSTHNTLWDHSWKQLEIPLGSHWKFIECEHNRISIQGWWKRGIIIISIVMWDGKCLLRFSFEKFYSSRYSPKVSSLSISRL